MPNFLKLVLYIAIFFGLLMLAGAVGHKDKNFGLLIAFMWFSWFIGGLVMLLRVVYRFVTR